MWKDFKWVEKRFGTKFANILKGVKDIAEEGGQEISNHFITSETGEVTFKDLDDNNHVLVTTEALQDEDSPVKELFDESVASVLAKNGLIEVKWQELKDKRDNGQLIPGSLYRITDYQCTTTQENTRSAGHQFDIVLLALSEDKLTEEGWAMEHQIDLYDVTFDDGVTLKCYVYIGARITDYNVVRADTLMGITLDEGDIDIDEINKTAVIDSYESSELIDSTIPISYFQNSNLSAWKVWYCLDNDTARFAWADDSVDEGTPSQISVRHGGGGGAPIQYATCIRNSQYDTVVSDINYYCFEADGYPNKAYTRTETPSVNDPVFTMSGGGAPPHTFGSVESYTPAHEGTGLPNGRGVIYRLIDELNNDVAYDFKNIQYIRKLTDGKYYEQGINTWCYTFNVFHDDVCDDATIVGNELKNDEDAVVGVFSNKIESEISGNSTSSLQFGLSSCIVFTCVTEDGYFGFNRNLFKSCSDLNLNADFVYSCIFLGCSSKLIVNDAEQSIYINNKKVLTEE